VTRLLQDLALHSAARAPDAIAVKLGAESLTYAQLAESSARLAAGFAERGVRAGDRIGVFLDKSPTAVAAMQAGLRLGAPYVPLDPLSPIARIRTIVDDCGIEVVATTPERAAQLAAAGTRPLRFLSPGDVHALDPAQAPPVHRGSRDDLAYILYTSGSTGVPKGVCISHENALAFVEWAAAELGATAGDRFSCHAPFHFDLTVLDLYCAFLAGASVALVPEAAAYLPQQLVQLVESERPTIWYSVPTALVLMMDQGGLTADRAASLRAVCFAGEPFPIKHLQRLQALLPGRRLLNLYGPTETNVCTYYEVREALGDRTAPLPIGRACSGDRVWAVKEDGSEAAPGEEGELVCDGPTVLLGYWGKPPQNKAPYKTGDIAKLDEDGHWLYLGRRDDMVKVRGHRVELGDVESALLEHPAVNEVGVIVHGDQGDAALVAYVALKTGAQKPSLIQVKAHCAQRLPRYMVVDKIRVLDSLPRTRNGKVDRKALRELERGRG
jgi:amino acid adenylation domain-containing protein